MEEPELPGKGWHNIPYEWQPFEPQQRQTQSIQTNTTTGPETEQTTSTLGPSNQKTIKSKRKWYKFWKRKPPKLQNEDPQTDELEQLQLQYRQIREKIQRRTQDATLTTTIETLV